MLSKHIAEYELAKRETEKREMKWQNKIRKQITKLSQLRSHLATTKNLLKFTNSVKYENTNGKNMKIKFWEIIFWIVWQTIGMFYRMKSKKKCVNLFLFGSQMCQIFPVNLTKTWHKREKHHHQSRWWHIGNWMTEIETDKNRERKKKKTETETYRERQSEIEKQTETNSNATQFPCCHQ